MIKAAATTKEDEESKHVCVSLSMFGTVGDTMRELAEIVNAVIRATYQNCPEGTEAHVTLMFAERLADTTKKAYDDHMQLMKEAKQ